MWVIKERVRPTYCFLSLSAINVNTEKERSPQFLIQVSIVTSRHHTQPYALEKYTTQGFFHFCCPTGVRKVFAWSNIPLINSQEGIGWFFGPRPPSYRSDSWLHRQSTTIQTEVESVPLFGCPSKRVPGPNVLSRKRYVSQPGPHKGFVRPPLEVGWSSDYPGFGGDTKCPSLCYPCNWFILVSFGYFDDVCICGLLFWHPTNHVFQNILRSSIIFIEARSIDQDETILIQFNLGRAYGVDLGFQFVVGPLCFLGKAVDKLSRAQSMRRYDLEKSHLTLAATIWPHKSTFMGHKINERQGIEALLHDNFATGSSHSLGGTWGMWW